MKWFKRGCAGCTAQRWVIQYPSRYAPQRRGGAGRQCGFSGRARAAEVQVETKRAGWPGTGATPGFFADFTVTPPPSTSHHVTHISRALVHHRRDRRSRLVRGGIPREPREPLLERLVRNPRGRRRGELALLRAALRGEPPHLRRGHARGERSGPGSQDEARHRTSVPSEGGALLPSSSARAHTRGHSAESCSPGGSARISPAASMPGEG